MRRIAWVVLAVCMASSAAAQDPSTGFPPYGSFQDGQFDAVNRKNLNAVFAIPIVSSPGRGTNFGYAIVYNSLIWKKFTWYSTTSWRPVTDGVGSDTWGWSNKPSEVMFGQISTQLQFKYCSTDDLDTVRIYNWAFTDANGTRHPFSLNFHEEATACHYNTGPRTGNATDGSGYYLDATDPYEPIIRTPSGLKIIPDNFGGRLTDTNGNYISNSGGIWTDTANHQTLQIDRSVQNVISYKYLDGSGPTNRQTITVNLQTINIKTNFGCSGVNEFTGSASLPVSVVLPNGKTYSFTYEPTPNFSGYYTGRVLRVTLPTGGYYEYQYPTSPNNGIDCSDATVRKLTRVIHEGTSNSTWVYDRTVSSTKTIVTDPVSNQSTYTFSGAQLTSQKAYAGGEAGTPLRTVTTTWAANGTPASSTVILEDGQTQSKTETDFDTNGKLLESREFGFGTGAPGDLVRKTTNTYTTIGFINDRMTRMVVRDGAGAIKARTDIAYDGTTLNCVTGAAQHDDANYGCTFTARGNPTSTTSYSDPVTPAGGVTRNFTYDSLGNLRTADVNCCQQKQLNFSATTQYAYPDSVDSGPSPGTQLRISATYNSYTGLVASSTDENNKTTSFAYDVFKRLSTVTRPDNAQITYNYEDTARTVTVDTPVQGTNKVRQKSYFDTLGRSVKSEVSDGAGGNCSSTEVLHDLLSRPFMQSNPATCGTTSSYWTETRFDSLGRVSLVIPPDGSPTANRTVYSYSLATVTVTDPAGKARKSESDALGRMVKVFEPDVANPTQLTKETWYTYSVLDMLTLVSYPAPDNVQTRSYVYDGLGRLTSQTTPEAGTWNYQYNAFNLVTQRTDARGVITTYAYDTLNRPTSVSYNVGTTGVSATATVDYFYDEGGAAANALGRLTRVTDGVGSETYTYDQLGRATQVQKVINSTTYTTGYTYNLASELLSITYPSGRVVEQNFDGMGRLSSILSGSTTFVSGFQYDVAGQVTQFAYGNGIYGTFEFTAERLQLNCLDYSTTNRNNQCTHDTTTRLGLNYGYTQNGGNNGQITSITDNTGTQEAGRSVTYTYDALYRLSTAVTTGSTSYPQWGLSWTYDRYGNRTNQGQTAGNPPTNSVTISATTNRITDPGYAYDANGNMTNDGLNTMVYDAENRLVSSTTNGNTVTYTLDGSSLRVKKINGSTTTVYIFSGAKVVAEYENGAAPGSPTREYIYSGAALLAKIEAGATKYYHPDQLSNRVITDSSGTVVAQSGHYPYGENWYETGGTNKLKFTSYEREAGQNESRNDYAMFRTSVNRLGRFNAPDPIAGSIANPQSLNRYAYVENNPVNLSDPLGLYVRNTWADRRGGGGGLRCGDNSLLGGRMIITVECFDTFFLPGILQRGEPRGGGGGGEAPDIPIVLPPASGVVYTAAVPPPPPGWAECVTAALLEVIAHAEGMDNEPNQGYNTVVRGTVIDAPAGFADLIGTTNAHVDSANLTGHPGILVDLGHGRQSTAFGRYQILQRTGAGLGPIVFTPGGQDLGATILMQRRNMIAPAVAGNLSQAILNGNREWASLPGSRYGQPTISMVDAISTFHNAVGRLPQCQ